jgi:hypothetical protein
VPTTIPPYSWYWPDIGQEDPTEWATGLLATITDLATRLSLRVEVNPSSSQTGSYNLTGNGTLGGDLTTGTLHTGGLSTLGGNVAFASDNTYDIGPGGVSRPRDVTVARDVNVGRNLGVVGTLGVTGTTVLTGGLAGSLAFATDNAYDIGPGGVSRPRDVTAGRDVNVGRNLGVVGDGLVSGTFGVTGLLTASAGIAVAGGQRITLGASGQGLPTFTTVSAGEKVTLFSAIDASHTNYAIGVASNVFWLGIPTSDTARSWSFRAGTTEVVKIDGTGQTTLSGAQQTIDVVSGFAEWRFRSTGTGYGHVYGAFNPGLLTLTANVKRSGSNWTMDDTAANGSLVQLESNQVRMLDATYVGPNATVTEMFKATLSALTIPGQFAGATMALSGSASIGTYVAAAQFGVNASNLNTVPSVNGDTFLLVAATQNLSNKTITASPISGSTGSFTTLAASGNTTLATVVAGVWNGTIIADAYLSVALAGHTISGGSISGTPISGSTGSFTTLASSGLATLNSASITTTLGVTGTSTLGVLGAGATTVTTLHATSTSALDGNVTVGASILPNTVWTSDIGSQAFKMRDIYAQGLNVSTLVSQDVLSTIGGRILVGPTTSLVADAASGDTAIVVKHNNLSTNDAVLLQTAGQYEWLLVTSNPVASGNGYSVNVTRNLAGNGAKAWKTGDAVFNTGQAGNGYWDFFSQNSSLAYPLDFIYNHDNAGNSDAAHELGNYSVNYAQSANWTIFGDNAGTETHDSVYFGVQNTTWNTLAFYIGTAAGSLCTFVWEFWNGSAWTTFTPTQTGGANFGTLGWNQVAWSASSLTGWASKTVNSQTAYWVRVRISVFGSGFATKPVQTSKRVVYNSGANTSALYLWRRTATGSTTNWNALSPALVLGDLAGSFGYTSQTYGLAAGDYSGGNYLTTDPTNGLRIFALNGRLTLDSAGLKMSSTGALADADILYYYGAHLTNIVRSTINEAVGYSSLLTYVNASRTVGEGDWILSVKGSGSTQEVSLGLISNISGAGTSFAQLYNGSGGTLLGLSIGSTQVTPTAMLDVRGNVSVTQVAATSGTPYLAQFVGAAHTTLAAAEAIDVNFALNRTVQFTGSATPGAANITTQRAFLVQAPTYSFSSTGAQTIGTAATFTITGAPVAGTNATLTNTYALWVQAGISQFDGAVELTSTFHQKLAGAQLSVENSSDSGSASTFLWQSTASSFAFVITRAYGHTAAGATLGLNNVDLTELRSNLGSALLVYTVNNVPLVFGTNNAEVARFSGAGAFTLKGDLAHQGTNLGFYNTAATTKKTVTGSRAGNAALASLLTQLAAYGLITDSSS